MSFPSIEETKSNVVRGGFPKGDQSTILHENQDPEFFTDQMPSTKKWRNELFDTLKSMEAEQQL